ncbi:hypothetical protein [Nitratifractor sp.]|uniref:toxin-antitoxin system YwqK family antitoxin n=1 Tax=Nitratifractor sp. TaxID=2268144 RepID=UPI0025DC1420|nr:hypothetical protein [Nitratifractor sp.]
MDRKIYRIRKFLIYFGIGLLIGWLINILSASWDRYQKQRQALHQPPRVGYLTREYWPSKRLRREIPVADRRINGPLRTYDRHGTLRSVIPYRSGKRHGKAYYYGPDGNFQTIRHFRNDRALFPLSLLDCPLFKQSQVIDNRICHV